MIKQFFTYLDEASNNWSSEYSDVESLIAKLTILSLAGISLGLSIFAIGFAIAIFGFYSVTVLIIGPILYSFFKFLKVRKNA
jgi:hypothetical protein